MLQGWTPLMFASYHGRVEVVSHLVRDGADKLIVGRGQTALIIAASSNNMAILSAVYDVSL